MTLGVGKYYHPGGYSAGGAPDDKAHPPGPGTPPWACKSVILGSENLARIWPGHWKFSPKTSCFRTDLSLSLFFLRMADRDMSWTPVNVDGSIGGNGELQFLQKWCFLNYQIMNFAPNIGTLQFPDQRIYQAKWGLFHGGEYGPYGNFVRTWIRKSHCSTEYVSLFNRNPSLINR